MTIENTLTENDLRTLVQIAGELTSRIDLHDLLQLILSKSGELTNSPDGAVLLYNSERNTLYFAGAIGENSTMLLERFGESGEQQIPLIGSKAGTVFSSGNSIIVDYVPNERDHYKGVDKETNQPTQSMLCVPLTASDQRLGVMQLLNKRSGDYDDRDRILLEQFANYAAVALRNARLFEELIAHMGLYTDPRFSGGVAELLNQLKSPARSEKLTVLFADMRGFRLLCQVVNNPERIVAISSQFVTMLSEQVLRNGGVVNKFLGDGILAIFRNEDHARRSVKCAFAMLDEFQKLKLSWDQESIADLDFLDIGIGITTDEMIIGTIGKGKIHDFTVIGTAVNLAAAFEKEARGGKRILVDHLTYIAIKDIVSEIEGPINYELRQPDQRIGNFYKQYHLKQMVPSLMNENRKTAKPVNKTKVFVSYSHQDSKYLNEGYLIDYLLGLEREGFEFWHDKKILAGDDWDDEIKQQIENADVALILVSQAFLNSKYCADIEVESFLKKQISRGLIIFPIILSPCDWNSHTWLTKTQFEPRDGKTIEVDFNNKGKRDQLYLTVLQQLRKIGSSK